MADLLGVAGKVGAMTGVRALVDSAKLYNSVGSVVDTISISTPTSDFAIDANGQITNAVQLDFTVGAGSVGTSAEYVQLLDSAGTGILLKIYLGTATVKTTVALTTEGTASFAIGAFTADL